MRNRIFLLTVAMSLGLSPVAWGQTTLSNAEVQQILQQVTSRPRRTWIPAGTIKAMHQEHGATKVTNPGTIQSEIARALQDYQNNPNKPEKTAQLQKMTLDAIPFNVRYQLANAYDMLSDVEVRYDGNRFYWEINVTGRSDSIPLDPSLQGNFKVEHYRQHELLNRHRIFAWDGQRYTVHSASGNRATVDTAGRLPRAVNGPLTAGLIPWGYGSYTAANLAGTPVAAVRTAAGAIEMTLTFGPGSAATLTLDPAAGYAVTKAVLTHAGGSVTTYTCAGYQSYGGNWVPASVSIERRNGSILSKLATSEQWTFTSVSTAPPASFNVPLPANTVVEFSSPLSGSPSLYIQSGTVDTEKLLAQHLAYIAAGSGTGNCATAALRQVAAAFGKSLPAGALARLVGPDGRTSLYDMKRFAESQGLFCRAVQTDLASLRNLDGVQAILHLPGQGHFVVLSGVDDRDVWLVDLSSRKFFYRRSADFFALDWPAGTALLVCDRPLGASGVELSDAVLAEITGSAGWDCNTLLQEEYVSYCGGPFTGCDSGIVVLYERWGCGSAPSGSCDDNQLMISSAQSACDVDPYYECSASGEWYYYYMNACG
jgi:hypothetical protein